jgi:replicative DNA helicase
MIDNYFERFRSTNHPDLMIKKFPTGFEAIDKIMNGGLTAGVHTIIAQPGVGKSTFTLNLAVNMAQNGIPVLFFSFEMPTLDLVTKSYSRTSSQLAKGGEGFTFDDFRTERKWTPSEKKLRLQTSDWVETQLAQKIGFINCKEKPATANMIAQTIEHFIQTKGQVPLVIIDYLQLIGMDRNYASQKDNLERGISIFTGLVDKYGFPLIAISAIAKQNADSLSLFAGSETGRIAYSSVSVIGLSESNDKNDAAYTTVILKVFKNRYGQKHSDIRLCFDGQYSRFFEPQDVKPSKSKKAAG